MTAPAEPTGGQDMVATDRSARNPGLDVARGVLLVAMVAVHIVSAHGSAAWVAFLHGQVGVFLISAGFVGLSGYVIGLRSDGPLSLRMMRGAERALQLVLVMVTYGVLLSLLRHGLALHWGGTQQCSARFGWVPPLRFDDLGILLPIAIVQLFGSSHPGPSRRWLVAGALFAAAFMLLPEITRGAEDVVTGVLTRRTLTPFYTVSTFVAVGLVGVLLGVARPRLLRADAVSPVASVASLGLAVALSLPPASRAVLDPVYLVAGSMAGALATLGYWSVALLLLLRGFTAAGADRQPSRMFALLGRNSLPVFVAHDVLLVLDAFVRDRFGIDKGGWIVTLLWATNVALLLGLAHMVERSGAVRRLSEGLLLGRPRLRWLAGGQLISIPGAIALVGVLAVYTSSAMARPDRDLIIDDFESESCPQWWTFGFVPQERVPDGEGGHVLRVHGYAPGSFAHGRGVFLHRDIGSRRTLELRIAGDGPGSGRLKIELSEDDNGNWEIEKNPPLYIPEHDDRFVHELSVDWRGFRRVSLPIESFRDDNPGRGNDIFDPERDLTSGGLLELQLLFAPSGSRGDEVRITIDEIRFTP